MILDILSNDARLFQERQEAFEYRKKFYPGQGPTADQAGVTNPAAAFGGALGSSNTYSGSSNAYGGAPTSMGSAMTNSSYGTGGLGQSSQNKVYNPYAASNMNQGVP